MGSCQSPHAARDVLADVVAAEAACRIPNAPDGLAADLRRHAQIAQWHAVDLEEALQRQAAEHEAELAALRSDHKQRTRQSKLQLLAKWSPHHHAAKEAHNVSQSSPAPLLAIGAALSQGPPKFPEHQNGAALSQGPPKFPE